MVEVHRFTKAFLLYKNTCKYAGILGLTLVVLLFSNQVPATPNKTEIDSFRRDINRLQEAIGVQEKKIAASHKKELALQDELEILDRQMVRQEAKLVELGFQVLRQEIQIDQQEEELQDIRQKRARVEEHLKKRISAYYTMGDIGFMNVTFSTKSLPELLTFNDAFAELIKYDRNVILRYKKTIDSQQRVKEALLLEKGLLLDFHNQTLAEKKLLEEASGRKKEILLHVKTQGKLHAQAVKELNEAAKELVDAIVLLKKENQQLNKEFVKDKGSLLPPVTGVLTTLFKEQTTNKLGIKKESLGIALKAADGTEVIAISDGEVVYSGYLRGYGNTIIIHHGYQYYTVTARMEKLLVHKGDIIEAEDVIGISGGTATLFDEGLYFEIRHGKQSLDPLLWLDPNLINAAHE